MLSRLLQFQKTTCSPASEQLFRPFTPLAWTMIAGLMIAGSSVALADDDCPLCQDAPHASSGYRGAMPRHPLGVPQGRGRGTFRENRPLRAPYGMPSRYDREDSFSDDLGGDPSRYLDPRDVSPNGIGWNNERGPSPRIGRGSLLNDPRYFDLPGGSGFDRFPAREGDFSGPVNGDGPRHEFEEGDFEADPRRGFRHGNGYRGIYPEEQGNRFPPRGRDFESEYPQAAPRRQLAPNPGRIHEPPPYPSSSPYRNGGSYRPVSPSRIPAPYPQLDRSRFDRSNNGYPGQGPLGPRSSPHPRGPERSFPPLSDAAEINARISARYGDPTIMRLVQSASAGQGSQMYGEISQLIDQRHLKPTAYEQRVKQALKNLSVAVTNPAFQRANGISLNAAQSNQFQGEILRIASQQRVATASDASDMLNLVMEQAGRGYGIRPAAVVMEFVFGATESLDPYTAFVPEVAGRQPGASAKSNTCDASTAVNVGEPTRTCKSAGIEDSLVGIGVEIKPHTRGVEVIKSLTGGPAQLAGLRAGDVILAINNRELVSRPISYAVELISGVAGSSVTLSIERESRSSSLTLRRSRVEVRSVSEVRLLGNTDKVGYIKLEKFAQKSEEEMDRALWSLHQQGMRSLVIDLRGNPGGLLTTAISLTDKFLPGGVIVSTRGRNKVDSTMTYAKKEQTWKIPLVVLIDENSASASEIFAAAIQENGRGMVVGRRSYGKGTVQTHFPLKSVPGNLRLTTAQFYSPKGRVMAGTGVEPDVRVDSVAGLLRGTAPSDRDLAMALEVARSRELFELPIANTQRGAEATPSIPRS